MKHIFKNRQGETIVEVLVSFLLLMLAAVRPRHVPKGRNTAGDSL